MSSVAGHPQFDVIVGGGVLGSAVAARLSRTSARVALVEAETDLAEGASKGNAGVAVSYYGAPGTQQTQLINASNPGWEALTGRLDVPFRRLGGLMVALTADEEQRLQETLAGVHACGVRGELLTARQVRDTEPLVSEHAVAGLLLPDEGVIDPMRLTIAFARLATANGVSIRLGERVLGIEHDGDLSSVITSRGRLRTRFVVNAAGVEADHVSALASGETLRTWPRKGQYVVLDRAFGEKLTKIVFSARTPQTKGSNVVPTTHDCRNFDFPDVVHTIRWYVEAAAKVLGKVSPTGPDNLGLIVREPVGVVGAVLPWNFPAAMLAWKITPALAAGNSLVIKPPELASLTTLRIAELATQAGVPAGQCVPARWRHRVSHLAHQRPRHRAARIHLCADRSAALRAAGGVAGLARGLAAVAQP